MPVLSTVKLGKRVEVKPFNMIRDQLVMDDGELSLSFQLPAVGNVTMSIIPESLIPRVVEEAHRMSEHGSWTVMYEMLRGICYFPGMNLRCQEYCRDWQACCAANGRGGATVPPTDPDIFSRPSSVLQANTLELGADRS